MELEYERQRTFTVAENADIKESGSLAHERTVSMALKDVLKNGKSQLLFMCFRFLLNAIFDLKSIVHSLDDDEFGAVPDLPQHESIELEEGYAELAKECLQIKVNEQTTVIFNVNDPIFKRYDKIPEHETEEMEDWSRCNCCNDSSKKLKWCDLCGNLTCVDCVNH